MNTIIRYLKLPFRFSAEQMQQELQGLSGWVDHYNQRDYEGSWTVLPLRSEKGSLENVVAFAGDSSAFADTILMQQCPYLKKVVDAIPCEKNAVRLLNLQAGAIIKEHKDRGLNFETGEARIHVPVVTCEAVEFYLEDERMTLEEGECWYMNFNLRHRVVNAGSKDRIHLVIDCVVNEQLSALFLDETIAIKSVVPAPEKYTEADKKEMIRNLLRINTPTALQMMRQIQESMNA